MARTLSPAEFLDAVDKSKLLDPTVLEPYRGTLDRYADADALADAFTSAGLITRFQADNLRQGKYQGFFLGPYKMLEKVGSGTTAIVYLAEHTRLKQRVAIKVLMYQKAKDAEALGRFEREAKAAAAVRHPNVVHAFDVATAGRVHYMVMEYVDGVTLLKRLTDGGREPPRLVARQLYQAAQGLHAAHQVGVVHRDVKPGNLMVAADGTVKVMDLGLARYDADDALLTQGKAVVGAVAYCAPEQTVAGTEVDARADVYALGATFTLAATGKRPSVVGCAVPDAPPRSPAEEADYHKLVAVLRRMTEPRPEDRYQSMADVCAALTISGLLAAKKGTPEPTQAADVIRELVDVAPTAGVAPSPATLKPISVPSISLPSEMPLPALVFPDDEVIPYAVAADEVPTAYRTPRPKRWDVPPPSMTHLEKADDEAAIGGNPLEFMTVPQTPQPTPRPRKSPVLTPTLPPSRTASGGAAKWVAAGVTFAAVLALLIVLFR
jgi:serine/threonine protein kinase